MIQGKQVLGRGQISSKYGVVAMKAGNAILDDLLRTTVRPELEERLGYKLVDMRDVSQAGIVDNLVRAQIRDAAFVLADLTDNNSGAYWQAGYAEGLGKPVIYICEKARFDEAQIHFDTNHCTTVCWIPNEFGRFADELVATLRRFLNLFPAAP